jgi:hypothetical protein
VYTGEFKNGKQNGHGTYSDHRGFKIVFA